MKKPNQTKQFVSKFLSFGALAYFLGAIIFPSSAFAITTSGLATPSATTYNNYGTTANFEEVVPPTGVWTSTSTTADEGTYASYNLPTIATCSAAIINSVLIELSVTGDVTPYTNAYTGVFTNVTDKTVEGFIPVETITSGTRLDGALSILSLPEVVDTVGRGVTNPLFTTVPIPIDGDISYNLDTTGMTADEYNNLALQVQHDLLDGPNGFITNLTSTQPNITVDYDDAPCDPVPTADPVGAPNTGLKPENILLPFALLTASMVLIIVAKKYGKVQN